MQATIFRTIQLPPLALGVTDTVNLIVTGTKVPLRFLARNLSGVMMFFGTASESMVGPGAPGNQVYQLPAGQETTIIIAPGQQLFGCANGAGALLTMSISEALPMAPS